MDVFMPERSGRRDYNGALLMIVIMTHGKSDPGDIRDTTARRVPARTTSGCATPDTPNGVIYRTLLDKHGEPDERELFAILRRRGRNFPTARRWIAKGCYGRAMFDGWRVARFSPQERLEEYPVAGTLSDDGLLWRREYENAVITATRKTMSAPGGGGLSLSGAIAAPCG